MLIAIDAHAIGRHLTGNEVYVRSLLNAFALHNQDRDILAYVSGVEACAWVPEHIQVRRIAAPKEEKLKRRLAKAKTKAARQNRQARLVAEINQVRKGKR